MSKIILIEILSFWAFWVSFIGENWINCYFRLNFGWVWRNEVQLYRIVMYKYREFKVFLYQQKQNFRLDGPFWNFSDFEVMYTMQYYLYLLRYQLRFLLTLLKNRLFLFCLIKRTSGRRSLFYMMWSYS